MAIDPGIVAIALASVGLDQLAGPRAPDTSAATSEERGERSGGDCRIAESW